MAKSPIIFLFLLLFSFSPKDESLCNEVKLFEKATFPIGVAINTDKLKYEEKYWKTAMEQFNSFTPERVMKPQFLHPKKDVYNFFEIDHLMDFCKQYKIRLHGHALVWHQTIPQWMEEYKGTPADWETLLKEHIQTVINHCKGYVKSWDVVNEAFNDDGTLRKNIWLKNIGDSYIEKAFLFAAQADSTAKLFYNDYSIEAPGRKLTAVLKALRAIKAKGIRVDGIGMQMHVSLEFPRIEEIGQASLAIQREGYLVHYSEMDVRVNVDHNPFTSRKKLEGFQKERVKEIVESYMKLNPKSRFGITMWGVSDNDSWQTEDHFRARPLLYNSSYKIKPSYCGFLEALGG